MPELPEGTRQSLDKKLNEKGKKVVRNRNLRFKIPLNLKFFRGSKNNWC